MISVVPPRWIEVLGTPTFDEIFQKHLVEELRIRKRSISHKIKVKASGTRITVEVDDSKDQNKMREVPYNIQDEFSSNLEASAGVKFIAAEAVRDAFKKTIEEIKHGHFQ